MARGLEYVDSIAHTPEPSVASSDLWSSLPDVNDPDALPYLFDDDDGVNVVMPPTMYPPSPMIDLDNYSLTLGYCPHNVPLSTCLFCNALYPCLHGQDQCSQCDHSEGTFGFILLAFTKAHSCKTAQDRPTAVWSRPITPFVNHQHVEGYFDRAPVVNALPDAGHTVSPSLLVGEEQGQRFQAPLDDAVYSIRHAHGLDSFFAVGSR